MRIHTDDCAVSLAMTLDISENNNSTRNFSPDDLNSWGFPIPVPLSVLSSRHKSTSRRVVDVWRISGRFCVIALSIFLHQVHCQAPFVTLSRGGLRGSAQLGGLRGDISLGPIGLNTRLLSSQAAHGNTSPKEHEEFLEREFNTFKVRTRTGL